MRPKPRVAPRTIVIAAIAALVAGGGGAAAAFAIARRNARPATGFALWHLRAGIPFRELEQRVWLEQRRKFACRPIVNQHLLCEVKSAGLPTTGTPGIILALVDTAGTVTAVQFRRIADTSRMPVRARKILSEWRLDVESVSAQWDTLARVQDSPGATERRLWRTPDGRAAAWLVPDPELGQTAALAIADERSLAAVRSSDDLAPSVLGDIGLSYDVVYPPTSNAMLGPALERRDVPICPAQYRLPHAADRDSALRHASWVRLLGEAIPLAYPGATLVVGDGLSLVRDGVPERLVAGPSAEVPEHRVVVHAIHLPDRAGMAAVREIPGVAASCRVPVELLFIRNGETGTPAETYPLVLDGEATLARVTKFQSSDEEEGIDDLSVAFEVEYVASYDAPQWFAQVLWTAVIQLREPRVVARIPKIYVRKIKATGEEHAGVFTVRRASDAKVLVSLTEPTPATKTLAVAYRAGAPFDMYELLARF